MKIYTTAQTNGEAWQAMDGATIASINVVFRLAFPLYVLKDFANPSIVPVAPSEGDSYLVDSTGTCWGLTVTAKQIICSIGGVWTILPKTIDDLLEDMSNNIDANLSLRKIYASIAAMNADVTNPIGDDSKPILKGQLVVIQNVSDITEMGKVYRYSGTGWEYVCKIGDILRKIQTVVTKPESVTFSNSTGNWKLIIAAGEAVLTLNGVNKNNLAADITLPTGAYVNIFGNMATGEIVAETATTKFIDENFIYIGRCYPSFDLWDIKCPHNINGKSYNLPFASISLAGKQGVVTKSESVTFSNTSGSWKLIIAAGTAGLTLNGVNKNNLAADITLPTGAYVNIFGNMATGEIVAETAATKFTDANFIYIGRCYPSFDLWDIKCPHNVNGKPYNLTIPSSALIGKQGVVTKSESITFSNASGSWKLIIAAGTAGLTLNGVNKNNLAADITLPTGAYINIFGNMTTGEVVAETATTKFTDENFIYIGRCWPQYDLWDIKCPYNVNGKPYNLSFDFSLTADTPAVTNTLCFKDTDETAIYKDSLFKSLNGGRKTNVILETTLASGIFKRYEIHNPTYLKASDLGTSAKIVFESQLQTKIYKDITKIYKGLSTGHGSTLKLMAIGDSLTQGAASVNYAPLALIKDKFAGLGITVQPCGTFNQDDGRGIRSDIISEGRGYWNYKTFAGKASSAYGQQITISSGSGLTTKFENPFLKLATSDDITNHPDWCFRHTGSADELSYSEDADKTGNFYIFDFANYLNQHSVTVPDVITIALGINDWQEAGIMDIGDAFLSMQIMYKQIRAALPNVPIMLIPTNGVFPGDQTQWETEMFPLLERIITYCETQQVTDINFHLCPIYQHIARFNAYATESGSANISTYNNVKQATMSDVHALDKASSRQEYMNVFEATLLGII